MNWTPAASDFKSKQGQGGYEKPQDLEAYIKKYGADVLRLWVASQDYRNDIIVSEERINKVERNLSWHPRQRSECRLSGFGGPRNTPSPTTNSRASTAGSSANSPVWNPEVIEAY